MSIRIYKTRTCGVCNQVKRWLNGVGHKPEEIYIDDDPKLQQYVYEKSGGFYMVPLTVVEKDGQEHYVSGGNIARLSELIIV